MKTKKIHKAVIIFFTFTLIYITSAKAYTAVASGDWSNSATWGGVAPGSSVSNQDIVIPSGITVNLDMDVNFSGLLNSFTVDGTLSSSTSNTLTISSGAFTGSGTVVIHSIEFAGLLTTSSFQGTLTVDEFINNGASLSLTAIVSVSDTLNLNAGTISLNTGANLTMSTNSTIKVNDGSMSTGGGVFNSGNNYDVMYTGSSKTTGVELNTTTLQNMYVQLTDSTQILTLAGNLAVNGLLCLTSGQLDFSGSSLTINGDLTIGPGVHLISSIGSDLIMQGIVPPAQGLIFTVGSAINNFTIDYSGAGSAKLNSALIVSGILLLNDGNLSLESGSTLIMNTASAIIVQSGTLTENAGIFDGSAVYNVNYTGGDYVTGVELSGGGLNNVSVNLTSVSAQVKLGSDVTIQDSLDIMNGKLSLSGNDLILNGTLDHSTTADFIGDSVSDLTLNLVSFINNSLYFDVSNRNINHLTVNLLSGGSIVLGNSLTVFNELNLQNGSVDLAGNELFMKSAASINNYSDTNYIITSSLGTLHMWVNASLPYVIFPVGSPTNYSPAAVQQISSGTSGFFMVRAADGVYSNGTSGVNLATNTTVVNRTWFISTDNDVTVSSNIRLGWEVASEVNGFDRTQAFIRHYIGGMWDVSAPGAATAGAFNTYEITRLNITSLSPFSVADVNAPTLVNEVKPAAGLQLYPNPSKDFVYLKIGNSTDNFKYELVDIAGGILMSTSNKNDLNKFDVSKFNNGFYFIRATNIDSKEIIVKPFIKD